MSEADRLFDCLGYEDLSDEIGFGCIKLYGKYDKRIGFYNDKTFTVYSYLDGFEYLDMQELQAINKKVEELRMDIEEQWREKTLKDIQEGKVIVAYAKK